MQGYTYLAGFKHKIKNTKEHTFDTHGVAVRAPDVPIPRFCMEFRPGSNGQGPGPQKPEKKNIPKSG